MLHITIACVGKIKESYLREGIAEYEKRLSPYCKLQWIEVADEQTPEHASAKEEEQIRAREGARLLARIPADAYMILFSIDGRQMDSIGFAKRIAALSTQGQGHLCFVIGGSLGLSEEIRRKANESWSFSALTFPHQLMRLIALEQIYRSFRIDRNEPYHK